MSRDTLILYAQNYKQLLKNTVFLSIILRVFSIAVFLVVLGSALGVAVMLPGDSGIWAFVIALLFAWALKKALFEPFAMAALMQVYWKARRSIPSGTSGSPNSATSSSSSRTRPPVMSHHRLARHQRQKIKPLRRTHR